MPSTVLVVPLVRQLIQVLECKKDEHGARWLEVAAATMRCHSGHHFVWAALAVLFGASNAAVLFPLMLQRATWRTSSLVPGNGHQCG